MSTQTIITQISAVQRCIEDLRRRGVDVDHVSLPGGLQGPRVYIVPNGALRRLPSVCYKIIGRSGNRTEHYSAQIEGCQVRWRVAA